MARTNNKYTSINYSQILHKDPPSSPYASSSSSSPASYSSVARSNGRMLVLTKPTPKPLRSPSVSAAATITTTPPAPRIPDQAVSDPDPNQISLRPLGHTGPGSSLSFPVRTQEIEKVQEVPVHAPAPISLSPKPDRFVPPHLRPGFVRKDEKPGLDPSRVRDPNPNQRLAYQEQPRQGHFRHGQTGRPKSGGYERIRTDPRSAGNRPGTSG
ncbi:hypothetical protein EUTSA_v10010720mg [Eutrema salsugineum]|uniref:Uncharacterized protein n=1 Tax=Eutrema salsugineum TaxID=72664 RepID=V4NFY5_EUTSA|nr:uncharacterized protein LOC18021202 [Eutrema salsugineum]ESQ45001.1 hypothetical protein EUTSA_v10010720mg [Eutrema salsugineum]